MRVIILAADTPAVADPEIETGGEIETGIGDEKKPATSGRRIRCPRCGWMPGKHDRWACTCGHLWNTFDTGGVCPACVRQWTATQCPVCHGWSAHSDWYEYG